MREAGHRPTQQHQPERQNNYNAQRIRELMENHGWKYDRRRINKKWVRAFWNPCHSE